MCFIAGNSTSGEIFLRRKKSKFRTQVSNSKFQDPRVKHLFHKQSILLFIAFCLITSCKLTGDFTITKRKHANGYYIETPSLVQNTVNKSTHQRNRIHLSEAIEAPALADSDNTLARINSIYPFEKTKEEKIFLQANASNKSSFRIKPIEGDPIYKGTPTDTIKTTHYIFPKRQLEGYSLIGFLVSIIDIPLTMAALTNGFISIGVFILILLQVLSLIFAVVGLYRIRKNGSIGRGFAVAAVILGCLYLVLMFAAFFILLFLFFKR